MNKSSKYKQNKDQSDQSCSQSTNEKTVESQLENHQNLKIDKNFTDNFYKYKHHSCICDSKLIDNQNDGKNSENLIKRSVYTVPLEYPDNTEKYLVGKQKFNGIQCTECYLQKPITEFSCETEIPTYIRSRWEITRRKLSLYRHHCTEEFLKPMVRDPCCWLACLWCALCICPRCYPM